MDVRKEEMENGLVVATEAMPYLRSASIGVWVRVGSRFEGKYTPGITHFIEHLLFKGTTSRSAGDIANAIDSIGGQLDAFTDKEYVGFYAKVLDRHVPFAFELLSDIVLNPGFPGVELERERNVIFEEINMVQDSPQELIHDVFMENFWRGHPLGLPISGTKESVARITRREVRRYFKENYTACNTIVSVAGNIRHRQVLDLTHRHFAGLAAGTPVERGCPPGVYPARVVRRKAHLEQTHVCLGTGCPPIGSADRYCIQILNSVLGGGMSSRLFQNIREKRGLVYSIYSVPNLYRDAGTLVVYAGSAPETAASVVELTLKELRRLRDRKVPAEELKRAKENIKGQFMLSLESTSARMTHLAQQEIYYGRFYTMEEIMDGFDRVRASDVCRLAGEIFDSSTLSLTALTSANGHELKSVNLQV
jgi:predicted Zn-dependent peptidase